MIDTFLYSPSNDKYAAFIITENPNNKLLDRGNEAGDHYNAYCFIGKLNRDSGVEDLTWINAYIFVRYKTLSEASSLIREEYFKGLTLSAFKYNMDDIRFWNGPIWEKYYK